MNGSDYINAMTDRAAMLRLAHSDLYAALNSVVNAANRYERAGFPRFSRTLRDAALALSELDRKLRFDIPEEK